MRATLTKRIGLSTFFAGAVTGSVTRSVLAQSPVGATIAVLDFNNSAVTEDAGQYEPFRAGIADILLTELSRNGSIVLVERAHVAKLMAEQNLVTAERVDPSAAARIGKMLGAQYVLTGGFVIDRKGHLRLDARAINVETSSVAYVESVSGEADDLLDLTAALAGAMNSGLRLRALRPADRAPAGSAQGGLQSLLLYSTALIEESRNPGKARSLYAQFLQTAPADYAVEQRRKAASRLRALNGG